MEHEYGTPASAHHLASRPRSASSRRARTCSAPSAIPTGRSATWCGPRAHRERRHGRPSARRGAHPRGRHCLLRHRALGGAASIAQLWPRRWDATRCRSRTRGYLGGRAGRRGPRGHPFVALMLSTRIRHISRSPRRRRAAAGPPDVTSTATACRRWARYQIDVGAWGQTRSPSRRTNPRAQGTRAHCGCGAAPTSTRCGAGAAPGRPALRHAQRARIVGMGEAVRLAEAARAAHTRAGTTSGHADRGGQRPAATSATTGTGAARAPHVRQRRVRRAPAEPLLHSARAAACCRPARLLLSAIAAHPFLAAIGWVRTTAPCGCRSAARPRPPMWRRRLPSWSMPSDRPAESVPAAAPPARGLVVLRLGEIFLKGRNRRAFVRSLVDNARRLVGPLDGVTVEPQHLRLLVHHPPELERRVLERLAHLFGLHSMRRPCRLPSDWRRWPPLPSKRPGSCRTAPPSRWNQPARQALPMTSQEVSRVVAGVVAQATGLPGDVHALARALAPRDRRRGELPVQPHAARPEAGRRHGRPRGAAACRMHRSPVADGRPCPRLPLSAIYFHSSRTPATAQGEGARPGRR